MWTYRVMRALLRIVVRIFYRQVEVVGLEHVPPEGAGAVIFAGNHPNSLIDPVMIIATSGRIVHFAAKDVLFESRLLRVFLAALGAVPIRRRSDHGGAAVDNSAAFAALFDVLRSGRAMGIFPEGISHEASQLSRLKTGAARVALGMAAKQRDLPLSIIPCGLTFIHRKHFRSRVLVQYGEPIRIGAPQLEAAETDERAAARALTDEIDRGLRALTVNAPDWETLRVLDTVRRLYQPPKIPLAHRVELARRFAEGYGRVRERPDVVALRQRVQDYNGRLRAAGLSDADLVTPLNPLAALVKVVRHAIWVFVWLPLAGPGVVAHAPVGMLAGWGGHRFTPRKDVVGTTKLLIGAMLVAMLYGTLIALTAWRWGLTPALVVSLLLPLSGYATVRVLERTGSVRRLVVRLARAFLMPSEIRALRVLRGELEADVVRAVDRHLPHDMVPLYPRSAPPRAAVAGDENPAEENA